jgi:hypothetical protein
MWGEETRLGRPLAGAYSPQVLAIGGQAPSPESQKQRRCISSIASFSSKRVQQDEHDPNAICSTTIQALDLCDKSFGTYGGWGLELLGASLELVQGVRAPSRVPSALPFP